MARIRHEPVTWKKPGFESEPVTVKTPQGSEQVTWKIVGGVPQVEAATFEDWIYGYMKALFSVTVSLRSGAYSVDVVPLFRRSDSDTFERPAVVYEVEGYDEEEHLNGRLLTTVILRAGSVAKNYWDSLDLSKYLVSNLRESGRMRRVESRHDSFDADEALYVRDVRMEFSAQFFDQG